MRKRYLYAFLFAVPGFFVALIIASLLFGAAAGFLWIFVFGDNSWPSATEKILPILLILSFLLLWIGSAVAGYATGKKLEFEAGLNRKHILVSVVLTVVPILFIVLHQVRVGNIGPKSDGQLCRDFCREKGYAMSGMPPEISGPRSCFCYDAEGHVILNVPIENLLLTE